MNKHKHLNTGKHPLKILFASSEVWPLMKTGGLADVSYNLPKALAELGHDVRIIMPAYRAALSQIKAPSEIATLTINQQTIHLIAAKLHKYPCPVWLVVDDLFSARAGGPYHDQNNDAWPDNDLRFNLFCLAVSEIASRPDLTGWQPDIVHCNDWQTGLVPVYLSDRPQRPATVFTVHNLAYQGLFPHSSFVNLGLNPDLWRFDALEFYGQLSFIKGGLIFSDKINTVSPHYAEEVKTEAFGCGLSGLFEYRNNKFNGIINGINVDQWNPKKDKHLKESYDANDLPAKAINKTSLQHRLGLKKQADTTLLGWVGRLTDQKGIKLLIEILPELLKLPVQLVILGTGDKDIETQLELLAQQHKKHLAVVIGFNEALAHKIIASADFFLMPSSYEPCGLTQLYSLRYGAIPIASNVGGLVDTIVHISQQTQADCTATGFLFEQGKPDALLSAIQNAIDLYNDKSAYTSIQSTAMQQDFSWLNSAKAYIELYKEALKQAYGSELRAIGFT